MTTKKQGVGGIPTISLVCVCEVGHSYAADHLMSLVYGFVGTFQWLEVMLFIQQTEIPIDRQIDRQTDSSPETNTFL